MKKNIETVVFDLGGVLVDWNPAYLFRKIFAEEAEMNYFLTNVCTPEWNAQQDAGRSLAEATALLVARRPEYEMQIRAYYDRWTEMLAGTIAGTLRILEQIYREDRLHLYALTNWSHETFPIALERYDFLQSFAGIVVSGVEKTKKPEKQIYQILFDRYDIKPETAVFIDDSPKNVTAAQEIGMHGIHFQSPEQLSKTLADWGVI